MIESEKIYGLKGKQVSDLADRINENASDISSLGETVAGKQNALTATQLAAVESGIDTAKVAQIAKNAANIASNYVEIDGINEKIPAQASAQNQLADKDFVNSSIATSTASFVGTFNSLAELQAVQNPTNNDYGFVVSTVDGNTVYSRYKYNGSAWVFEYKLNNSSFTAVQWASINSGITDTAVTKLSGIETGAEVNDINSISVNGTAVTPDTNKNVALTIPNSAFTGTDGTAAGTAGLVPAPATTDAGKFLKADGSWGEAGGGGIIELTSADLNYNNNTELALWKLDVGMYRFTNDTDHDIFYRTASMYADILSPGVSESFIILGKNNSYVTILVPVFSNSATAALRVWLVTSDGNVVSGASSTELLTTKTIVDNLTTSSSRATLSAAQGKVLKDLIDSLAIKGAGAPTTSTVGTVGQLYEDGTNGNLYQLKSVDTTVTPNEYNWEKVGESDIDAFTTSEWNALWA